MYIKEWESFGRHWVKAFRMTVSGLGVAQVTLAGMLGAKRGKCFRGGRFLFPI